VSHAEVRYLEAKRSVDDRALSRPVVEALLDALPPAPTVFDAGCGTGATLDRLREWGVEGGRYRGVDADPGVVAFAREQRPKLHRRRGASVDRDGDAVVLDGRRATFAVGDALAAARGFDGGADLVVAASFLDLVDVAALADAFEAALAPGGLLYCPVTFDGGTRFAPPRAGDDAVEAAFHDAIESAPDRSVRAASELLGVLDGRAGEVLAVGGSDWVVAPAAGAYPGDEAYFLDRILGFVADALAERGVGDGEGESEVGGDAGNASEPAVGVEGGSGAGVDAEAWLADRRAAAAAGELTYVAHNLDVLYRAPG